ncbi:hypothetical protein ERJ75_001605200 [Trypanosoma vivax]|nr:hypothetical protein ERJ75_001605200 [Trypanosoma vivax]
MQEEAKRPHHARSERTGADKRLTATREEVCSTTGTLVNEVVRMLPCTCGRATLDARRLLLLISGDVERNPGPLIRGVQWNSGGLSRAKRVALERELREDMVLFCLLQETRLASVGCAVLKIGGCQHVGQLRTPHGGGVSILVRDGVSVKAGVLEKKVPESDTVTLRFSANASLTITSAHFHRKAGVSSESLETLLGASGSLVVGADVNSHHVLCDPLRPSDDKGECIVDWCVQNDLAITNAGSANRQQRLQQHSRHWTARCVETAKSTTGSPH